MATAEQVDSLRLLISELTNADPYTDESLLLRLDTATGDLNQVAYEIWTEKAAAYAGLVDISEGGSSRKMGDMYEQALNMAKVFAERVTTGTVPPGLGGGPRLRRITRV